MSNRIKKKYMAGKTYFDYPTLFLVIFLICFGMVMIYSTSSYKSMMTYGNSYKWVLKQGLVVLGGAIAIFLISRADYRIIKGHKPAFLCLGIATFSMIVKRTPCCSISYNGRRTLLCSMKVVIT